MFKLTIGGGVVFWIITILTSLLPIATEFRAAFSNWNIQSVWVDSLFVGLVVGFLVSYFLIRYFDKIPTKNPILKSMILGFVALVVVTILIDVPRSLHGSGDALYYFLIGVVFNLTRFLCLTIVIGYLYKKL